MSNIPQDVKLMNKRIQDFKSGEKQKTKPQTNKKFISAYQIGTRVAAELVSGVLVGAGLGYLLDKLFGSEPILLIILLILGGAAGFLNVYRFVKSEESRKE